MNCKDIKEKIHAIPGNELPYEERLILIQHIKGCEICQNEYNQYLKTFYFTKQALLNIVPETVLKNFKQETLIRINAPGKEKQPLLSKMAWYSTAAVIIISIWFLTQYNNITKPDHVTKYSIVQSLENENWKELSTILTLSNPERVKEREIPVGLLIKKLNRLKSINQNISSFETFPQTDLLYATLITKYNPDKIEKLNTILREYGRYYKNIPVNKIFSFVNGERS